MLRDHGTLCVVDKSSLAHMTHRYRDAETRADILRGELAEAIRQASREGMPQKDICEATGYTRQQVRRIAIANEAESEA